MGIYDQANETDLNAPQNFASGLWDKFKGLFSNQRGEFNDYLSRYKSAISGQEAMPHMWERIGNELNIPNLQSAYNTVSNTLTNLPSTLSSASKGFGVSANQLARQITTKASNLQPVVSSLGQNLSSAQNTAGGLVGAYQAQQQKELEPFQKEYENLSERNARETSGYSWSLEAQLNAIIDRVKNGMGLSEAEKARANELAKIEKQYNAMKSNWLAQADWMKTNDPLGLMGFTG